MHSVDANEMSPAFATGSVAIGQDVLLGIFPQKTRVVATISGSSTVSTANGCEGSHTYGVFGNDYGEGGAVTIYSDEDGLSGEFGATTTTRTIDVQGRVMLGQLRGGALESDCGSAYIWIGSGTGSVTRVPASLGLGVKFNVPGVLTEFNSGYPGRTLTWQPLTVPAGMRAVTDTASWAFTPDDGSAATPACSSKTAAQCVMVTTKSGTLTVSGYANAGDYTSASLHITVTPRPAIKLSVNKDSIAAQDTVHVTATITNATSSTILRYTYSEAATGTCVTAQPSPATCDLVAAKSGTLKVVALLDDLQYSDSLTISVIRCELFPDSVAARVTDALLKSDTTVRNAVVQLATQTMWDSVFAKQAEYGGWMVRNKLTNEISFVEWTPPVGLLRGQCLSGFTVQQLTTVERDFTIVADMHTHPKLPARPGNNIVLDGEGITCLDFNGVGFVKRPYTYAFIHTWEMVPGPSPADVINWQAVVPPPYPGYVISPEGISVVTASANGSNAAPPKYPINSCVGRS